MKKILQLMLLLSVINTSLFSDDAKALSNTLWQRNFPNSCSENFTFNPSSKIFTFVSTFGKKMIGNYVLEKVRNSKRLRITFTVNIDNGLKDCSSINYDSSNQTIVNYLWLENNGKILNIDTKEQGKVFNTYAYIESYTQENLALLQLYLAQLVLNEIQQIQSNLGTKTLQQQMAEMEKKQREESIALNKKILEQQKASKEKGTQANGKSWRDYLSTEQLNELQKFENTLAEKRRIQDNIDYHAESSRNEVIQNEIIQNDYLQEQITQDYYNEY